MTLCFNSIKVRLRQCSSVQINLTTLFQFHKGTIKTAILCISHEHRNCFNSIKVRLRLAAAAPIPAYWPWFQFHKGTIKTTLKSSVWRFYTKGFNSIKVRLRQETSLAIIEPCCCFNSIKVRLRRVHSTREGSFILFQFHKGTIKTHLLSEWLSEGFGFNSIKVRLRRLLGIVYFL